MPVIRPPAFAGSFYPRDPGVLRDTIAGFMREAPAGGPAPKALISPHAGYVYSGPVAASAYARAAPSAESITRVVLLGLSHKAYVNGAAATRADVFATPLGDVPVDVESLKKLLELPFVEVQEDAHNREHSLEVQLPFMQVVLGDFRLVPLAVGDAAPGRIEEILNLSWGGPETLVVVSTDLSHFLSYDEARKLDQSTVKAIEQLRAGDIRSAQACGHRVIAGILQTARNRGMKVETLDVRNSGDTAGPREEVVGYGAFAFYED